MAGNINHKIFLKYYSNKRNLFQNSLSCKINLSRKETQCILNQKNTKTGKKSKKSTPVLESRTNSVNHVLLGGALNKLIHVGKILSNKIIVNLPHFQC